MRMTPESKLKKDLKHLLTDYGAYWCMIPGGTYAKPGDPDIIACYKGMFIAIEAKTYEGSQSDWQKLREKQIRDAGGVYLLIKSVDQLTSFLNALDVCES